MKFIFYLIPFLFACCTHSVPVEKKFLEQDTNNHRGTQDKVITKDTFGIELQTFEKIPDAVVGCNALFDLDTCVGKCEYIFVTNLRGIAFIKVDGHLISLKRTKKTPSDDSIEETYHGDGFTVQVKAKQKQTSGDEEWNHYGKLQVFKKGKSIVKKVRGDVGC